MGAFLLVAFDLDDTLYLEQGFVKSGFAAVGQYLAELGLLDVEAFFQTAYRLFEEGARGNIFNLTLEKLGVAGSEDLIAELVRIYREHEPDIQPFPESLNLLGKLREEGCIIALVSDGPWRTQRNKLRALGLEHFFQHLMFTGAHGPDWSKPSTRPFLEIMNRSGATARECVYVADNPRKDFVGPNRLGWHTIRVKAAMGLYVDTPVAPGGEPHQTVDSLAVLKELLLP